MEKCQVWTFDLDFIGHAVIGVRGKVKESSLSNVKTRHIFRHNRTKAVAGTAELRGVI